MAKTDKSKLRSSKEGGDKVRPRARERGFLVRGKGKPQGQTLKNKKE